MPPSVALPDHPSIRVVHSFAELVARPLMPPVQAICWARAPRGDFAALCRRLPAGTGVQPLDDDALLRVPADPAVQAAVARVQEDLALLRAIGQSPELELVHAYPRDAAAIVPTDVHSFHVDTATAPTDTYLCTYAGPASEGLRPDQAERLVDRPAVRARLLAAYGGGDDAGFAAFLQQHCYDLHYGPRPGAQPFSFGTGALWRLAVQYPGAPVPACIHRAPPTSPGQPPRLLLIS